MSRPQARNITEAQLIAKVIAEVATACGFQISADRATVVYRNLPGEQSLAVKIPAQEAPRR